MTMMINIQDQYIEQFEMFINSLPLDAIEVKKSLDEEITKRVTEYKSGILKTSPFGTNLDTIREKLSAQL